MLNLSPGFLRFPPVGARVTRPRPVQGCVARSETDAFTDANGTLIQNHGANWALAQGSLAINSNGLYPNAGGVLSGAYWKTGSFYADQYAQAVLASTFVFGNEYIGVAVRCAGVDFYALLVSANGSASMLVKTVAGSMTVLIASLGAFAVGNTMRLEAIGTLLKCYKNGVLLNSVTDASLANGAPGVSGFDDGNTSIRIDDWEGGNLCP